MRIYDFKTQVRKGTEGEALAALYLLACGRVKTVFNRAEDPAFQKRGVDFEVDCGDGETCWLDVKTDSYTTGNFFFETVSSLEGGKDGCFIKSEAHAWFYWFPKWDRGYWLPLGEVQRFVLGQADRWRSARTSTGVGCSSYTSKGLLVPIKEVCADVPGVEEHCGVRALVGSQSGERCLN